VTKRGAREFVCLDVLREYGSTPAAARRRYRAYVHAAVLKDDQPILEAMQASRYAIGDDTFIDQTRQRLAKLRTGRTQDQDLALPTATVAIDAVDARVAKHYGIDAADLKEHGHRAGVAKAVAVELACRLTGNCGRAVGMHYGGISASAVGNIRRKVRQGELDIQAELDQLQAVIQKDNLALKCKMQA